MDDNDELPYDFDLCWDIKTVRQLKQLIRKCKSDNENIEVLCKLHGYEKLLAIKPEV